MTKIEKEITTKQRSELEVCLDSNIMREPQVFEKYNETLPGIAGLARDITIWAAWNRSQWAQLSVKDFAEMFGYSRAFLFKRLDEEIIKKLRKYGYKDIKDVLGYTLAKLGEQSLMFREGYISVTKDEGLTKTNEYTYLQVLSKLRVTTTRKGTVYSFQVNPVFLANCTTSEYYQRFNIADYCSLTQGASKGGKKAYPAARKVFLHLLRKRRVWDKAKKQPNVRPSLSNFEKLCKVAGINYAQQARNATVLRELLDTVGQMPGIKMKAEVVYDITKADYTVKFCRDDL